MCQINIKIKLKTDINYLPLNINNDTVELNMFHK